MKFMLGTTLWILVGLSIAASVSAEQYDFEVGLAFNSTRFDGNRTITTPGGTIFNATESDTDDLGLSGSWYFSGFSDDKGPWARAAFVNRASALNVDYARIDQSIAAILTSNDPAFPAPPISPRFDADGDSFGVDLHYVDRDSGWFGRAGLSRSDTSLIGFVNDATEASAWQLGFGKYVLDTTAIGLDFGQAEVNGLDGESIAVNLEHLGDLGASWQYAVDFGFNHLDTDGGLEVDTWRAALSLYPNQRFEFGAAVKELSGLYALDNTSFEGFASWFATPNVRLSARYRVDDVDYLGNISIGGAPTVSSADQDSFGIGISVRF
ncbi:MAG TPA: hypothetical protein PKH39_10665 [Woeseiaceae bacterium]|nr:hypothetical protein [Woeseiaceae bacterium]